MNLKQSKNVVEQRECKRNSWTWRKNRKLDKLSLTDNKKEFLLITDALNISLWRVPMQINEKGKMKPVYGRSGN